MVYTLRSDDYHYIKILVAKARMVDNRKMTPGNRAVSLRKYATAPFMLAVDTHGKEYDVLIHQCSRIQLSAMSEQQVDTHTNSCSQPFVMVL